MNRAEAISYLTRCADEQGNHWYQGHVWSDVETCPTCRGTNDAGHLGCPGSRYGYTSRDCADVAWRVWRTSDEYDESYLDVIMSAVVNNADWPEAELRDYAIGYSGADIDAIVEGYLDCQLWAQLDYGRDEEGDNPPLDENYGRDDISDAYVEEIREELSGIVAQHPLAVRMYLANRQFDPSQGSVASYFGHDLYLTREGHGAGFWDRGLGELGEYLTTIAKSHGAAKDLWDNGSGTLA